MRLAWRAVLVPSMLAVMLAAPAPLPRAQSPQVLMPEQSAAKVIAKLEELGYVERRVLVAATGAVDSVYSEEEEDEVTERLRDLGYL